VVKSILVHVTPPGRAAVQVAIPNDGFLSHSSFCTIPWDELLDAMGRVPSMDVAYLYLRELRRMVDLVSRAVDFERRLRARRRPPLTHEL
jgi:hypothetical protein